ncbi:hypothetical protein NIES39_M02770 [Arthrospira platensis NIES-39]|nr:hypothetical protein NIES39_M02770 [Arthrospira platensis NIES-39]
MLNKAIDIFQNIAWGRFSCQGANVVGYHYYLDDSIVWVMVEIIPASVLCIYSRNMGAVKLSCANVSLQIVLILQSLLRINTFLLIISLKILTRL